MNGVGKCGTIGGISGSKTRKEKSEVLLLECVDELELDLRASLWTCLGRLWLIYDPADDGTNEQTVLQEDLKQKLE